MRGCLRSREWLAAFVWIAVAGGLARGETEIPDRIPAVVRPAEFTFRACAARASDEGRHPRTFFFSQKPGTPGKVEFGRVEIVPQVAGDWHASQGQIADGQLEVTVVFTPSAPGSSPAELRVDVDYPQGTGRITETVALTLEGQAADCAPGFSAPDAAGGPASGADATPPGGGDGTPAAPAPAGPEGSPTAPDGDPGAPPPTGAPRDIELCLRFYAVDPVPVPGEDDLDALLDSVNEAYRGSGVRFRRLDPAQRVDEAPAPKTPELMEEDPHCLDVYLVRAIPGPTLGEADLTVPDRDAWRDLLRELGIDPASEVGRRMGPGRRCRIQTEPSLERTLAHELGHILGLGAGPDPIHRDPQTGEDITDQDRLMHGTPLGTDLTDAEKRIARKVAEWIEDHRSPCGRSRRVEPTPRSETLDPRGDLRFGSLDALEEELVFRAYTEATFAPGETSPTLSLELDTDADGGADRFVSAQLADGRWFVERQPAESVAVPAPEALLDVRGDVPGPVGVFADALQLRVPRAFLPRPYGPIGWRLRLAQSELATVDTVPVDGVSVLDVTPPALAIVVDADSRRVEVGPGASVTIAGDLLATPTVDGLVTFSGRLWSEDRYTRVPLGVLRTPLPARFAFEATLPDALPEGEALLTIEARCAACRRATSDVVRVVPPLAETPVAGVSVLAVAVVIVAVVVLMILLARGGGRR